jgi:chaperonin cofactor prefoldin
MTSCIFNPLRFEQDCDWLRGHDEQGFHDAAKVIDDSRARIEALTDQLKACQERCRSLEADLERGEANRVQNCKLREEAQGQVDDACARARRAMTAMAKLARELEAWQGMHAEVTREKCQVRVELELALTELRELKRVPEDDDEE